LHVRRVCLDEAGRYVNPEVYQPIARLHADNYIASDNQFVLKSPGLEQFQEKREALFRKTTAVNQK
jgi:hypothetical protein